MTEDRLLVLACGALAREVLEVVALNDLDWVDVECLPARLHNRPESIPAAVESRLDEALARYRSVFVAYADCGTGGLLDRVLETRGVERLPGAHCYEFYATAPVFAGLHDQDPGTFYLTDFLVKHFDRIVWRGLGLDRWPHLREDYFGNYNRLVYLSQSPTQALVRKARSAAARLGLELEHHPVGYGDLATSLVQITRRVPA